MVIWNSHEPQHDNTNKMSVPPAKTQISLGIRPVWSEFVQISLGIHPVYQILRCLHEETLGP